MARRDAKRKKAAAKQARARRRKRNLLILALETVVLVVMVLVLRTVVMPMSRMGRIDLNSEAIAREMNEGVLENTYLQGYTTLALFGVDSREGRLSDATLSDVIMVCAINKQTGDVRLCSVLRDTFLNVGDYYTKANAAYSWGGPEQAINMLNKNMDLTITDFATVGFKALIDSINELGGIEIDVDEDAVVHLNNYQWKMTQEQMGVATLEEVTAGVDYIPVTSGGYQTLNGMQATALCRVRYVAGGDFTRTSYQRAVLQAMLAKAKQNPAKVPVIAEKIFDEVYTSLTMTEILALAADVLKYDMAGQEGFPQMDMVTTGNIGQEGSCVVPLTLESNVAWLHRFLYEAEDYTPTATVKEYSEQVQSRTAPYLH